MKKNQNKIDKLFSKKFQQYKFEANEQDWSEMKSMLDERDMTGFWLGLLSKRFYFLLTLLAVVGVSSIYYFTSTDNKNLKNKSELSITRNDIENISSSAMENSVLSKNSSIDKAESSSVESKGATIMQDVVNTNNSQERFSTELSDRNEVRKNNTTNNLLDPKHSKQEPSNNFENTADAKSEDTNVFSDDKKLNAISSNDKMVAEPVIADSNESTNNNRTQSFENNSDNYQKLNDIETTVKKVTSSYTNPVLSGTDESIDSVNNVVGENEMNMRSNDDRFQSRTSSERNTETEKPMSDSNAVSGTNNPGGINNGNPNPPSNFRNPPSELSSSDKIAEPTIGEQNSSRVLDTSNTETSPPILTVNSDSAQKSNSQGNFSIGMTLSSAFISKKLKSSGNISNDYFMRRENEESNTVEFHGGLIATYHFKNILISSGFNYATYSEKIEYKPISKFEILDSTYVVVQDSTPAGGNIFDTIYTTFSTVVDTFNSAIAVQNGKTQWRYLEIPVMLWYRFDQNKFVVDAGFGGSLGMLQKVNAYYLSTELNGLESIDESGNYRNIVYNFLGGARVSYKIHKSWLFGIDLRYKQNLNSIFKDSSPVDQRFRSFNTGISVIYKFAVKK